MHIFSAISEDVKLALKSSRNMSPRTLWTTARSRSPFWTHHRTLKGFYPILPSLRRSEHPSIMIRKHTLK
ncbi:hypothetical protein WG66_017116 [Moniliophthora roreri]|nr:hypothetical protein WG66_017116 [Moniliophthora roreri]